ncbi:fibrobacter succinogenes major paralogous domain-containing protein [bacterium]|nr:fibrobacter succinogenes major paralogous domain-containing protein [bacterium]
MRIHKNDQTIIKYSVSNVDSITFYEATVTDIDGNVYNTVIIGNREWMAENLKTTKYRDGTPIPNVTDGTAWAALTTGAYCFYDNSASLQNTYGNLYNWYAVSDSRNIAPEGWHVPTDAEWKELEMALGMSQAEADDIWCRGTNEGSKLAGNADLWITNELEYNSEFGSSGFTALPGGARWSGYSDLGYYGYFWSATEYDGLRAWYRAIFYDETCVDRGYSGNKDTGFAVRCVKD